MSETWYHLDEAMVQVAHENMQRLSEERWQRYWTEQQWKQEQAIMCWEWSPLDEIVEQIKATPRHVTYPLPPSVKE